MTIRSCLCHVIERSVIWLSRGCFNNYMPVPKSTLACLILSFSKFVSGKQDSPARVVQSLDHMSLATLFHQHEHHTRLGRSKLLHIRRSHPSKRRHECQHDRCCTEAGKGAPRANCPGGGRKLAVKDADWDRFGHYDWSWL